MAGFGLGSSIFIPLQTYLVNPDDLSIDIATNKYPESVNDRFVYMQQMMLLIMGVLTVIGIFVLFQGPLESESGELYAHDNDNTTLVSRTQVEAVNLSG